MERVESQPATRTAGVVVHWAARYDLLLWLMTLGRERVFREKLVRLARLAARETVLDVGCGTGALAICAKRQVGSGGAVYGVDASSEMIARARDKAKKAGAEVEFRNAVAEDLPFSDAHFDAVLCTVMLHHLPEQARQQCALEIRRVLKPGGRLLVVDFGGPATGRRSLIGHFHRHAVFNLDHVLPLFERVGLQKVEGGAAGLSDLRYVLLDAPSR